MTIFEFIILFLAYLFSVAFTCELLHKVQTCILGRMLLFVLIIFVAPVFMTGITGAYLADMINKHLDE